MNTPLVTCRIGWELLTLGISEAPRKEVMENQTQAMI